MMLTLEDMITAAHGDGEADLLLKNAQLVNVTAGTIHDADIAIKDGRVIGFGAYAAKMTMDLDRRFVVPGLIDAHVHLESSMVIPPEFARAVLPHGTTTVVTDPHEIANVHGLDGIRFMLDASADLPLRVQVMFPSCVPATHMETAGAALSAEDYTLMAGHPRVTGLAEMMNFPGVIFKVPEVLAKLKAADGRPIDGHAPLVTGKDLAAYAAAGIGSDHECTTRAEAEEKLRNGLFIFIREGTTARNLKPLLPLVTPQNAARCCFCTDDRHPGDLLGEGHIDSIVRAAIALGLDPITAVQMATINPARYFGLRGVGAVAPGWHADLCVVDDLKSFNVEQVYAGGRLVAEKGRYLAVATTRGLRPLRASVNVSWYNVDFKVPAPAGAGATVDARVIGIIPEQIVTRSLTEKLAVKDGGIEADPSRDILKIAVVERHHASGRVGVGFVKGTGLKRGALASSVAHDSHNIVVIGASDADMITAVIEVVRMRGGQCVVDGDPVATLPLPIAGLMSDQPLEKVRDQLEAMTAAARERGCVLRDPFMAMAFLALPVIPELKITDHGLVDVMKFAEVPVC